MASTIEIPTTLRWRPMPAPLEQPSSELMAKKQVPETPVPCRRCLQDSQIGEEMILMSYDPWLGDSPYRCASPIYLHSDLNPCAPSTIDQSPGGMMPEQQRKRLLSVRAYGDDHMIEGFDVVDGNDLIECCERLFKVDAAKYCHVHYAAPGCFAVRVDKV